MALRTETYDFDEEIQRLEDAVDELAAIISDDEIDTETAAAQGLQELRNTRETELQGVRWARDEAHEADYCPAWDEDVDAITLAGLTGGEVARVQDNLTEDAGQGAMKVEYVAAGTPAAGDGDVPDHVAVDAEAPYVDESQSEEERLGGVSRLPHPFQVWAQARIEELTSVGGNGRLDYDALHEELRKATPPET